ncbi:MAG TPA: hypothetical protein VK038_02615 [Ornithinicoccus sp.]|nr:hypothetical protein [Ornithinicoccus sp.]
MTTRTGRPRRLAGVVAAAGLATGAVATAGAPATAYDPDPEVTKTFRYTDECPCYLADPVDGTSFKRDVGGMARKIELRRGSTYLGKVEFHPLGEKVWVYDTRNDGDTFYVWVYGYDTDGVLRTWDVFIPPSTSNPVDVTVGDMDIPEGVRVEISVYDDIDQKDLIVATNAKA